MSSSRSVAAFLSLTLVAAPNIVHGAGDGPISGEQIRALISGNTINGAWRARAFDFSYQPDGTVYGAMASSTDSGTWAIRDGDRYCHEWTNLFDGTERCYQWHKLDGGRYRMINVDSYHTLSIDVWGIKPGLD